MKRFMAFWTTCIYTTALYIAAKLYFDHAAPWQAIAVYWALVSVYWMARVMEE